jgi:DTW domain-containing protein
MTSTKRLCCTRCLRPQMSCICKYIQSVDNQVELIILQHPLEVNEAKNSGRLLHLCLNNSQLHIGEQFDDIFFNPLLGAHTHPSTMQVINLLLYPNTSDEKSLGLLSPSTIDLDAVKNSLRAHKKFRLRLWVLDATWRKSRKMLYLNTPLQTMPRMNLTNCPQSIYTIRKAHSENQLSTLEASCYALQELEQYTIDYRPVINAFSSFIKQRLGYLTH